MDPLTDLGVSVATEVATSLFAKIKKHVAYLYKYKDNLNALQAARVHLEAKRTDASKFSDNAKTRLQEVGSTVTLWQSNANKLHQKADNILSKDNISCLYLPSRYCLSKHAWELTQDINKKVGSAPDFGTSFDLQITGDKFNLTGFMDFSSRQKILSGVLEALRDDNVSMYSICGMGGIGKTTMAKKLVQVVIADGLFDKVAMVVVSQNPNFEKIQNEIIELLGLKFEDKTMPARANKLKYWLSDNRTLLILDDVWWQLDDEDFDKVGIPLTSKECKIVITSRNVDECKKMGCKTNFRLQVLEGREAWDLFVLNAGAHAEERNLQETARKIVDECDGLPIAIISIATGLKDKPDEVWFDSLRKLQRSSVEKVYSCIQLSYDLLNDSEAQSLLLLCCLFPEDYNIPVEKLVFYGWSLEYFEGVDSLKEARYRADSIIDKLKSSFLLLDGKGDGCVKLHDIVRDFAISVSSKAEYPYLVRCEKDMEKWPWPETRQYKKCKAISVMCNTVQDSIPVDLRCQNLELLKLQFKEASNGVPDGICEGMEELKIVDLEIGSQLPRLAKLKKLKTLLISIEREDSIPRWVEATYFKEMLGDDHLKNLEIFSLSMTRFSDFPVEIGQLCNLRCLLFDSWVSFRYIPRGILSNLVKLEELTLPSFWKWGLEDTSGYTRNASLNEIESLPLYSLKISVKEGSSLSEKFVKSVTRFQISMGCKSKRYKYGPYSNVLQVNEVDAGHVTVDWMSSLLSKCDVLTLEKVGNLKFIMFQQSGANSGFHCACFSQLKSLNIDSLGSLEEIWHGPYLHDAQSPCFNNLAEIKISNCYELKRVFPMSVARELTQLKSLMIIRTEVEEILYEDKVDDGFQIEEEGKEKVDERGVVLPRLKLLHLEQLYKLKFLYNGNRAIEFPSLEELTIEDCIDMEAFSHGSFSAPRTKKLKTVGSDQNLLKTSFSHLEDFHIEAMTSLKKIWCGPYFSNTQAPCFGNLTRIEIVYIPDLKHAFPLSVAIELRQLQVMRIALCEELEEVFYKDHLEDNYIQVESKDAQPIEITVQNTNGDKSPLMCPTPNSFFRSLLGKGKKPKDSSIHQVIEESVEKVDEGEVGHVIVFPQLKQLHLETLPKLRILYDGNKAIEFPSLEFLSIADCSNMEYISHDSFNAPKTKSLDLRQVRGLNLKWLQLEQESRIGPLESLSVSGCREMKYLVDAASEQYLLKPFFSRLEELRILSMYSLEEIWRGPYLTNIEQPCFTNLTKMYISYCPKMKHVFPLSVVRELRQLQELGISACNEMEQVFYNDQVDGNQATMEENTAKLEEQEVSASAMDDAITLPQLQVLRLDKLSKLRIFFDGNHAIEFPSLKNLTIKGCTKIEALSNGSVKAPKLQEIQIDEIFCPPGEDLNNTIVTKKVFKKELNLETS